MQLLGIAAQSLSVDMMKYLLSMDAVPDINTVCTPAFVVMLHMARDLLEQRWIRARS